MHFSHALLLFFPPSLSGMRAGSHQSDPSTRCFVVFVSPSRFIFGCPNSPSHRVCTWTWMDTCVILVCLVALSMCIFFNLFFSFFLLLRQMNPDSLLSSSSPSDTITGRVIAFSLPSSTFTSSITSISQWKSLLHEPADSLMHKITGSRRDAVKSGRRREERGDRQSESILDTRVGSKN